MILKRLGRVLRVKKSGRFHKVTRLDRDNPDQLLVPIAQWRATSCVTDISPS
jgi:hypothetical protein